MEEELLATYKRNLRGGVKELVDAGVQQVPDFYVKAGLDKQPNPNAENEKIPVIDLSKIHGSTTSERVQVVQEISKACKEWGFFQIVNHGVSPAVMDNMLQAVQNFFNLPLEERMEYYSNDVSEPVRYGTSHNPSKESVLEWKDYLRHPCLPLDEVFPKWPKKPSTYRNAAKEYCQAVKDLVQDLLQLLSEGLGLESDYLHKAFGEHLQVMQCNYYPPCPNPELAIGISEHSDVGGITVLLQNDVEGLEVFHNGHWVPVPPLQNAFVVNLGDHSQIMSNGKYQSVMHRGRLNHEKLRMSIATFYQPSWNAYTRPIPELLNDNNPPLYKSCTFGEYLANFFANRLQAKKPIDRMKVDV